MPRANRITVTKVTLPGESVFNSDFNIEMVVTIECQPTPAQARAIRDGKIRLSVITSKDTKPPVTSKRGRKPTKQLETPPAHPQGQGEDSSNHSVVEAKGVKSNGPMVDMKPGARIA